MTRNAKVIAAIGAGVLALCCGLGIAGALLAPEEPSTKDGARPAATSTAVASPVATSSPEAIDPTAVASALPENGIPPKPNAATLAAYIRDLQAINPEIVGDKDPDRIAGRGRDQCGSIFRGPNDRAKLVDLTNKRFTAPGYPNGFGLVTAEKILAVVHKHLCPTYPMAKG